MGTPKNLTAAARKKGAEVVIQNKVENENWKRAITFIEHFEMKHGYVNYSEISKELNDKFTEQETVACSVQERLGSLSINFRVGIIRRGFKTY